MREILRHGYEPLKGTDCKALSPLSLLALGHGVKGFVLPCTSVRMGYLTTVPKSIGTSQSWLKPVKV